jgi:membrane protein
MMTTETDYGRHADKPTEIPARGWKDIAKRVWKERADDNLSLLAAGVAFYAMLALFPTIISLVTIYALVADPSQVTEQLEPVTSVLPQEAGDLLTGQLESAAGASDGGLTLGLVISLLAALWAASGGVSALMTGINAVYDEQEKRNFVKLKAIALGLTVGAIVIAGLAIGLVAVFPAIVGLLNLGSAGRVGAEVLRWVLLAVVVSLGLAVFYRVAPSRAAPRWRWVSWGAAVALVIWILGSIGFSVYVRYFGSYNKTYGTLAAVVILMLWLYLSAYVVLLGAEIDAELERQTVKDTTTGREQPMGEREAHAADTLGAGADRPAASAGRQDAQPG